MSTVYRDWTCTGCGIDTDEGRRHCGRCADVIRTAFASLREQCLAAIRRGDADRATVLVNAMTLALPHDD